MAHTLLTVAFIIAGVAAVLLKAEQYRRESRVPRVRRDAR